MKKRPDIIACEQGECSAVYRLQVPADLVYFAGHFPGSPILPGVVQIEWAEQLARSIWQWSGAFCKMDQLKFQAVIRPGTELTLRLNFQTEPTRVLFSYESVAGRHSSGRISFA